MRVVLALIASGYLGAVRVDGTIVVPSAALHAFEQDAAARRQSEVPAA